MVQSTLVALLSLYASRVAGSECRCIPGDSCWPSPSDWSSLNDTVQGQLIATIPLAAPCHDPSYNSTECETLKNGWAYGQTHIPSSSSFVSPLAQNHSCDPFASESMACTLGNYPIYAVNASSPEHVAAAIKFANLHNMRLIIKSTGADLLGKSSGKGSLSVWMHSFQNFTVTKNYNGSNKYNHYNGPAARIEPGLVTYEIIELAQKEGYQVMGATCPLISIAGGFTAGGGISMHTTTHGLHADNVLEWDVIVASGERVAASPSENPDLYWALSGGGAGVFAVVLGVTVKVFPDGLVTTVGLSFNTSSSPSEDIFWFGIEAFHLSIPNWLDHNATFGYVLASGTFTVSAFVLLNKSPDFAKALITPFLFNLTSLGIPYTLNITAFDTFLDAYSDYAGPLPYGSVQSSEVQASRLMPRSLLETKNGTHALAEAQRTIAALHGGAFWVVGTVFGVPRDPSAAPSNSVLPALRNAAIHQNIVAQWDWDATWDSNVANQNSLINDVLPALKELSPGSGTYLNEGNSEQSDWKEAFYGDNYSQLKEIKGAWDPDSVFYARTGVGSDDWMTDAQGRLCRKATV